MIEHLRRIARGEVVSLTQAQELMTLILDPHAPAEQVGAALGLLNAHEISSALLAGFALALEEHRVTVPIEKSLLDSFVDVCGTGGDSGKAGTSTFNVSTTVAFLAAACGLPIAKHGNRAVSSRSGSFDVLEALGIPFSETAEDAATKLSRDRLAFLYAPAFHPALKKLAPLRRLLGFRTVFNALGPLLNPVGVKRQLVGVYARNLLVPMAEALQTLGTTRAMIVHGDDGLDELSLCAPTQITELRDGTIHSFRFTPEELGLRLCQPIELKGGDPAENARIIESILGGERGPRADLTCLNTAAALLVGGLVTSIKEGFEMARHTQEKGLGLEILRGQQHGSAQPQPCVRKPI